MLTARRCPARPPSSTSRNADEFTLIAANGNRAVAIGTGVPGNFRYPAVRILGEYAHVGLPRRFRRDAVLAASDLAVGLDDIWRKNDADGRPMAFTIGRYGVAALRPLALLMGSFYLTCILFVVIVLGTIAALTGFSIFRFIGYISDEILTIRALGTCAASMKPACPSWRPKRPSSGPAASIRVG
jgi:hypothetical protein